MVRLVDGKPPVMPSAKTSSFKFVPELRLFSTIQEELIFAMPLSQVRSVDVLGKDKNWYWVNLKYIYN